MAHPATTGVTALLALGACANIGPFRAAAGDDAPDGGSMSDSRSADAVVNIDAPVQTAQPTVLATSSMSPWQLVADGGNVYFTEQGTGYSVARVAGTGGTVHRISAADVPSGLAARDGHVVWTGSGSIQIANDAFTAGTALISTTQLTGSLALSSTHVYYARGDTAPNTGSIARVSVSGGSAEPLYSALVTSPALATGGSDLFWTAWGTGRELRQSSFANPTSYSTVATVNAKHVVSDGTTVCWSTQPDVNMYKYDVWCRHQGQSFRIASDIYEVFDIALTDSDVYVAIRYYPNNSKVLRYGFVLDSLTTFITMPPGDFATELATDGDTLYWIASHSSPETSGTIFALDL